MQKVTGSYKNYNISNTFQSKTFLNYTIILITFFDLTIPTLQLALTEFYREIIKLFTIYKWQSRVLFLALDFNIYIIEGQPTNPNRWSIQTRWQLQFCNLLIILGTKASSQKQNCPHSSIPLLSCKKDGNDSLVNCILFNKGSYT